MRCIMFVMPVASDTHSHKSVRLGREGLGTEDGADETSGDLSRKAKVESDWFEVIAIAICAGAKVRRSSSRLQLEQSTPGPVER